MAHSTGRLLGAGIEHQREFVLVGIGVQHRINLLCQLLIHVVHRAAGFILRIFRGALQRLCLFVDGPEAAVALRFTQVGAGVLQLLLERIDLVALGLQLSLLGLELHPQLSEVPLPFIGRGHRLLESDDGNLAKQGRPDWQRDRQSNRQGVGAEGADAWANALLVDAMEPTPVADASRQTSVNERFIGIQNSF